MSVAGTVAALPRIVRFLGTDDAPGSNCPHCGAEGRWILNFVVEDGRRLGAMRGCAKLFPTSRIALEELRLRTKAADYAKKGWTLNRGDQHAMDSIGRFYAKEIDERAALAIVDTAKASNVIRFRGRR